MFTASLISVLVLASPAPALRVEISSPKTSLFVFEPVKVDVRITTMLPVSVPAVVDATGYPLLEPWIDYGQGYVRYVDDDGVMELGIASVRRSLGVGDRFVETLVLVNGPMDRPTVPFPNPGRFSLRVVALSREKRVLGESNAIAFDVVAPEGDDAVVLQRIRNEPWVLRGGLPAPAYTALTTQYPNSPYLNWGKQAIAVEKASRIGNGRFPDTNEKYAETGQGHPLTPQLYRQHADDLRGANWGQFDAERLWLAAESLSTAGDFAEAESVWQEILDRFPGSEAAEQAKGRIDTTPPTLQVSLSPASLWPPNHRMVTVNATVNVSDDQDPSPAVKLVSITCDDGCVPASDIMGAEVGTDDRDFQVRAERRGPGEGRTYTITYSATDASGNEAQAVATVVVPHDRGKN